MIKTTTIFLLSVLASTNAFAPNPAFGRRAIMTPISSKSLMFMTPHATEQVKETLSEAVNGANVTASDVPAANEAEELSETQKLMKKVKESGTAGIVSYALWELAFWAFSVPVCVFGYKEVTGHWPDLSNSEDLQKLGAEAFAFVNFARFAVPLRIGLALSTTPWIQENIIDRFKKDGEEKASE